MLLLMMSFISCDEFHGMMLLRLTFIHPTFALFVVIHAAVIDNDAVPICANLTFLFLRGKGSADDNCY